jgi:3-methyladenine DNA glycosylase AlkD
VAKTTATKKSEQQLRVLKEIGDYIRGELFDDLITKAQCYAESLIVGREI